MTAEGAEALRLELKRLTSTERPRIVQEISAALAQGDLRENAEFQYAKEEQGHIEGRISEIAAKLGAAQIINIKEIPKSGKIIFGVTVRLLNACCFAFVLVLRRSRRWACVGACGPWGPGALQSTARLYGYSIDFQFGFIINKPRPATPVPSSPRRLISVPACFGSGFGGACKRSEASLATPSSSH